MQNAPNKIQIVLRNLALTGFLVSVLFAYWAIHLHNAGESLDVYSVLPLALGSIVALTGLRTWLTLKLGDENT